MKRVLSFGALLVPSLLMAETANKVGFVDLQRALLTVDAGKNAKSAFEKEVTTKKADLEKRQTSFQKEAEEFDKKAAILNDSAKQQKQVELQKKFVELQKNGQEFQMEMMKRERELTQPIVEDLKGMVAAIGKEKSLQFILEKNDGGVIYAEAGSDMTDEVIERYNKTKGKSKKK